MRVIAVVALAVVVAAAVQFSIPPAKSQSLDDMARCQSLEDVQRRTVCLDSARKPLPSATPLPRPRPRAQPTEPPKSVQHVVRGTTKPFEGLWALTKEECLDEEGPNSRTMIDLRNLVDGKPVPLFDQYENHCRIEKRADAGGETTLSATCFEFWEYFAKGTDGVKTSIKLLPKPDGSLVIEGKTYWRCERASSDGRLRLRSNRTRLPPRP